MQKQELIENILQQHNIPNDINKYIIQEFLLPSTDSIKANYNHVVDDIKYYNVLTNVINREDMQLLDIINYHNFVGKL
jgi:hypothetical protein